MPSLGPAEYLGHRLLKKLQENRGKVSKTSFYKFWTICDRELLEQYDIDVGVPRYWYKYGELVDEPSVNSDFYSRPQAPWGGQAYKPDYDISESDFNITSPEKEAIGDIVIWASERFGGYNARELEMYQYENFSPNDFIYAYSQMREYLQYTNLDKQKPIDLFEKKGPDNNRDLVIKKLDEMLGLYPEDERYENVRDLYLLWDDTVRLVIKQGTSFSTIEVMLDEFVEVLGRTILRLEYNSDVSEDRMSEWDDETRDAVQNYRSNLESRRSELLTEYEDATTLGMVGETFDETVLSDLTD